MRLPKRLLDIAIVCVLLAGRAVAAPADTGKVRIDCEAGVSIFIDGRQAGVATFASGGITLAQVEPGRRRIGVAKPGFKLEEHAVTVLARQTEILAVFYLQRDSAKVEALPPTSDDPLKQMAELDREVVHARSRLDAALLASPVPSRGLDDFRASYDELRRGWDMASVALDAARREQAEAEAMIATQFRAEYAAFHTLRANRETTSEQKHAIWARLLKKWGLPADLGPSALVWRQHRVAAARGNLRVKLEGEWPDQLAAPTRMLDGRLLTTATADPRDPSFWEIRDLTAAPHTLRIEHPALEPTEATLMVTDAKTLVLTWSPRFRTAPTSP